MRIEEFLKKLPAVMAVLTSEKTKERLSDNFEGVSEAVDVVMEASTDAAKDITFLFEELYSALWDESMNGRSVRTPFEQAKLEKMLMVFDGVHASLL